jgi:hypothetical protein
MLKTYAHLRNNIPYRGGITNLNKRRLAHYAIALALCFLIAPVIATTTEAAGDPQLMIAPIGTITVGQSFILSGTTNLAPGDQLQVEITSSSFGPTPKGEGGGFSGVSGVVFVKEGTGGVNTWQFPVDTTGWIPDDYIVLVTGITVSVTSSTNFSLVAATPTETTVPATSILTSAPTTIPSTTPTTPAPTTTSLGGAIVIAALFSVIVFCIRRR